MLPENVPAAPVPTDSREEFAGVLRNLGADLAGEHPIMDGKPHTKEVLIGHGAAPFNFDRDNKENYFVHTMDDAGKEKLYWGLDLARAVEESGAKIGDVITAQRTGSKLVTVKELREQPDGRKQEVKIQTRRSAWEISSHGIDRQAVIKAYDANVQTPADRRQLEEKKPSSLLCETRLLASSNVSNCKHNCRNGNS